MRRVTGFGTPKGWADGLRGLLLRLAARLRAFWPRRTLLAGMFRLIFWPEPMLFGQPLVA